MPPGCRSNCRLSESLLKPTTMLYRNLLAMDAEELLCGHPLDALLMAATRPHQRCC
jgi:hypothetical protein